MGRLLLSRHQSFSKKCVDDAVRLYSAGSTEKAIMSEWNEIEPAFRKALSALRVCARTPSEIAKYVCERKENFCENFSVI